jgi:selenocysteine lyase/cysteine desulfurase
MTFDEARAAYPVLERFAYLNAGTFGPLARATLEAVAAQQTADLERGRAGKAYFERMLGLRESVRGKLAAAIGVEREHVAVTTSTTEGCNVVVNGLGLTAADEIVTTDSEHFGLMGPLLVSPARLRIAALAGRPPEDALEIVLGEVTDRTRLLALSHVTWTTGQRLPLVELKEATGLPLLVDGAQAAGAVPVDARPYDFYTVSAQKWLCGPDATGGLYVRDPERLGVVAPSAFAHARHDPGQTAFEPRAGAARFDGGWIPPASLAGLDVALDLHPEWRFERAAEMAERCRCLLSERFEVATPPGQGTLVSIRPPGDPAVLTQRLFERGVVVRDLPGTGLLRASCGYWTSDDDLDRLVSALDASP